MIRDNNSIVIPETAQRLSGIHKAGFTAMATVAALLFAPQAAAQCAPPTGTEAVPAPASGTVTCQPGDYADGIHYDSLGDLILEVPDGAVDLRVFDTGINVTGLGGDNIAFDAGDFTSGFIRGTDGAVIDYRSDAGDIDIVSGQVIASGSSITHAILAESGAGDITIDIVGFISASAGVVADVEATSDTGNIVVNGSLNRVGLIAETGGAGSITVGGVSSPVQATTEDGDITATGVNGRSTFISQTGDITADIVGVEFASGVAGTAVTTQTDGLTTLNLSGTYSPYDNNQEVGTAVRSSGASDVAVTVTGDPDFDLYRGLDQPNAHLINGKDNGLTTLGSAVTAAFDFSGLSGGATITLERGSGWFLVDPDALEDPGSPHIGPRNTLSDGDDVVNILPGAVMSTPIWAGDNPPKDAGFRPGFAIAQLLSSGGDLTAEQVRYTVDFGAGADVLNMAGDLQVGTQFFKSVVGGSSTGLFGPLDAFVYAEMRLQNLTTFNHSGTIWLGASHGNLGFSNTPDFSGLTDGHADDILSLPGTHFVGELDGDGNPLGLIRADAALGRIGQTSGCGIEHRNDAHKMPVADCIDLRDGHASGKTLFIISQTIPGDRGAYNPEGSVLVDVGGDNADLTDPDAFGISPESVQFGTLADGTGVIDKGLFFYTIAYDPANEQYRLYGLPGSATQQFPLLRQAANSLWRTSTNAWFDRQVDQRDVDLGAGTGTGVWGRATVGSVERDLITPIEAGGETLEFDNSYTQDETTATIGWDLISRDGSGGSWLVGGMLGYTRGDLSYDNSRNTANLEGMHAGAYASLTQGGFYLDAALNLTWLDVDNDVPSLALSPDTAQLGTEARSTGGRLEAGYRLMLGPVGVEPLAGLSWVKTKVDDIDVPADDPNRFGGTVQFKSSTANNASAGLRLSLEDLLPNVAPTGISLTVRAIDEINARAETTVENLGPIPAVTSDDLEGSYTQLTGSVNVTNPSKTLAGYVNFDLLTGDDYDANSGSAGLRYQW
jgi:hypothetical protein